MVNKQRIFASQNIATKAVVRIKNLSSESKILGAPVLLLDDWESANNIIAGEAVFVEKHKPKYVYCCINATELATIHQLEQCGYHFSEFRIKTRLNPESESINTSAYYPFQANIISEKKDLKKALSILEATHHDDRFSNDPAIGSTFSKERVVYNLKKSFRTYPKEFLLGLFNTQRAELVAFRSGAIPQKNEAFYYQYGVLPGADFEHTAIMLEAFTIDHLKSQGIEWINAVSTGFNTPELNRLLKHFDFRITETQVLLRKVF